MDIGSFSDDVVGCDTLENLVFGYNGSATDAEYNAIGLAPPAAGYRLIQGPRVPSANDSAWFDFRQIEGFKNLWMSSFAAWRSGDPYAHPSGGTYDTLSGRWWKALRGYVPTGAFGTPDAYHASGPFAPSRFPYSGDPVAGTGWLDGLGLSHSFAPGDIRTLISSGPFSLMPGDTQEVVIALVAGLGSDRLSSVAAMKTTSDLAQNRLPILTATPRLAAPLEFELLRNYPNPFNPSTTINVTIPEALRTSLTIFDLLGREVVTIVDTRLNPGTYSYEWNGTNSAGVRVSSGVYFYRIIAGSFVQTRKMVLMK